MQSANRYPRTDQLTPVTREIYDSVPSETHANKQTAYFSLKNEEKKSGAGFTNTLKHNAKQKYKSRRWPCPKWLQPQWPSLPPDSQIISTYRSHPRPPSAYTTRVHVCVSVTRCIGRIVVQWRDIDDTIHIDKTLETACLGPRPLGPHHPLANSPSSL